MSTPHLRSKLIAGMASALMFQSTWADPPPGHDIDSPLHVVSRTAWHAMPPDPLRMNIADGWKITPNPSQSLTTITIHHTGDDRAAGPRGIQLRHRQRGFADIGYHFLIDEHGVIYEGRDLKVQGAHTAGHNEGAIGVALIGDFSTREPHPAQFASLRLLILHLKSRFAALRHLAGHHDYSPDGTSCPGSKLEARLPMLAREMGLLRPPLNLVDRMPP